MATEEAVALLDVPAAELSYLCDGHGCGVSRDVRHGGRGKSDLLTHLTEVRYVLKERLRCDDPALLSAALFHSIYGTEGFQGKVMPLAERPALRALIGDRAEFIVYLNCVMDRASLDEAVRGLLGEVDDDVDGAAAAAKYAIRARAEHGGARVPLTGDQLRDLMRVHFADWCAGVRATSTYNPISTSPPLPFRRVFPALPL